MSGEYGKGLGTLPGFHRARPFGTCRSRPASVPLTAGRYVFAGKVTGSLGGPPESATVQARAGLFWPFRNWKSQIRPGVAAGAKNDVGPSTRGCPVKSSLMAVAPFPT